MFISNYYVMFIFIILLITDVATKFKVTHFYYNILDLQAYKKVI